MRIDLKFIVLVDNCCDIEMIADSVVGEEGLFSYRELGRIEHPSPKYVGVVFEGSSPGDSEIMDLLMASGITQEIIQD